MALINILAIILTDFSQAKSTDHIVVLDLLHVVTAMAIISKAVD